MNAFEYIAEARAKKRITQKELAEKTGISLRTIQRIENGEVIPRPYTIRTIEVELEIKQEPEKTYATSHFSLLKWIIISSLCLPLLHSIIALWYWSSLNVKNQARMKVVKNILYLNLFTSCIAIPLLLFMTALILRSFDVPTTIRFIPIYVPIYGFYALLNLWFMLKALNQALSKHFP